MSYKFGKYFGMFSAAGNKRVETLAKSIEKGVKTGKLSRSKAIERIQDRMEKISEKYEEVYDTDVREQIAYYLDKPFDDAGYERLSIFDI
jgi:hypothetical protein